MSRSGRRVMGPLFSSRATTGWKSLIVQERAHEAYVADVSVPAVDAYCLVVVTGGAAFRESWDGHRWSGAEYTKGSATLTAPGRAVRARWRATAAEPFTSAEVLLPYDVVRDAARELGAAPAAPALRDVPYLADEAVAGTTRALLEAGRSGDAGEAYARSAASFLAVHLLTRHADLARDELTGRVLGVFRGAVGRPASLRELAALAGVGESRLAHVVRESTGQSPGGYLIGLRIAEAKRLLIGTTLPITEVGHACGFTTPSHFAASFRRATGLSPRDWRRGYGIDGPPGTPAV
ncbi:helix-turn-helix domain-containing protein [Actinoplanes sp. RD1]|uniref:helix-turn-helix domain-containing protein n=1 Tax=Actinoplanes sp. RD1 TaxID=3064538 RepID=UPI00274286E5|nr:AraC family transcriptional regulator [Actinoplanes sp. RD1]